MRHVVVCFVVAVVCAGLSGCGPVLSSYLIASAQAEVDGATAAGADSYAPYEITAATTYLKKAREEQGFADFGPSIKFASKARSIAQKASSRAEREKRRIAEMPDARWEAPAEGTPSGQQPQIIIEKRSRAPAPRVKAVPIPQDPVLEEGTGDEEGGGDDGDDGEGDDGDDGEDEQ